jgi:hypothetical protein
VCDVIAFARKSFRQTAGIALGLVPVDGIQPWGASVSGNSDLATRYIAELNSVARGDECEAQQCAREMRATALRMYTDVHDLYRDMNRRLRALDTVTILSVRPIDEAMAYALGKDELYPYAIRLLEALAELEIASGLGVLVVEGVC